MSAVDLSIIIATRNHAEWVLRPDYLDIDACYTHPALAPGVR